MVSAGISAKGRKTQKKMFAEDLNYVRQLLKNKEAAWEVFILKNRANFENRVRSISYDSLTDTELEEVSDAIQDKIAGRNFKVLRDYKGKCSLNTYINKIILWSALKDWFRKKDRQISLRAIDEKHDTSGFASGGALEKTDDALQEEAPAIEEAASEDSGSKVIPIDEAPEEAYLVYEPYEDERREVPEIIYEVLPKAEIRLAFLLRYYDSYVDFSLSPSDIRFLAERTSRPLRKVTELLAQLNSPHKGNPYKDKSAELHTLRLRVDNIQKKLAGPERIPNKRYLGLKKELESLQKSILKKTKSLQKLEKKGGSADKVRHTKIAKIMKANENTVRTWLAKALIKLKENRSLIDKALLASKE